MIIQTSADPVADALQQLAMTAGAAIYDEIREDLLDRLASAYQRNESTAVLLRIVRETLENYSPFLAGLLADSYLASWLTGGGEIAGTLDAVTDRPPRRPPPDSPLSTGIGWEWDGDDSWLPLIDAAVSDLKGKYLLRKSDYQEASEAVRQSAFTVAGLQTEEAIGHVHDALTEAVRDGTDLQTFQDRIEESFGASPIGIGQLENVFRTGTASAYSAGMDKILAHPVVADAFPYEETLPIDDSRLTELCDVISHSGIQGTGIYRRDDPVWRKFKPPRHWRCRCGRRPVSIEEAADRGIREAEIWLETGEPPYPLAFVKHPDVELPKGWNAGSNFQLSLQQVIQLGWVAYTGQRGLAKGRPGWRNTDNGRIVFQPNPPKPRGPAKVDPPKPPQVRHAEEVSKRQQQQQPAPAPRQPPRQPASAPTTPPAPKPLTTQDVARAIQATQNLPLEPATLARAQRAYGILKQRGNVMQGIRQLAGIDAQTLAANPNDKRAQQNLRAYSEMMKWSQREAKAIPKAIPVAQPAPKPIPKPPPLHQQLHAKIHQQIASATHLSAANKKYYSESVQKVLSRMPEKALQRFAANMKGMHFYDTNAALGQFLASKNPGLQKLMAQGAKVGGAYQPGKGALHLDGDFRQSSTSKQFAEKGDSAAHHTYAHEFAHAVDGPKHEISGSAKWAAAFKAEIASGKLSGYAATEPSEGFAEFARLAYASSHDQAKIEKAFPQCVAVWKEHGIWPTN